MSKSARLFTAVALLVVAFFGESMLKAVKNIDFTPVPDSVPQPEVVITNVPEPVGKYKDLVQGIVSIDIDGRDAENLVQFYMDLENMLDLMWSNGDTKISTTGNFRDYYIKYGSLNTSFWDWRGLPAPIAKLKTKYPGLGLAIDTVIMAALGDLNSKITNEQKVEIKKALQAVSWAVTQ